MSADSELPRGYTQLTNVGSNTTPIITFPAVPGIAWALTSINYAIWGGTAVDTEAIEVNGVQWPAALSGQSDAATSWTGQVTFPINTAVVVTTSGPGAVNRFANLEATAYPV